MDCEVLWANPEHIPRPLEARLYRWSCVRDLRTARYSNAYWLLMGPYIVAQIRTPTIKNNEDRELLEHLQDNVLALAKLRYQQGETP